MTRRASSLADLLLECALGDLLKMYTDSMCTDVIALAFLQIAIALSPVIGTPANTSRLSANAGTFAWEMIVRLEPRAHVRASAAKLVPHVLDRIRSGF